MVGYASRAIKRNFTAYILVRVMKILDFSF